MAELFEIKPSEAYSATNTKTGEKSVKRLTGRFLFTTYRK